MRFVLAVVTCALVAGLGVSALAASEYNWPGLIATYQEVGFDNFAYSDGNLNGKGPWSGGTGARTYVSGGTVQMWAVNSGGGSTDATWDVTDLAPASGKIIVGMRFTQGGGNKCQDYKPCSGLEVLDQNGVVLGALNGYKANDTNNFYVWGQVGPSDGVGPNPGAAATQTSRWQLGTGWTASWMVVNTSAKTVQFLWYDGTIHDYGTLSYGSYSQSSTLGKIRIMAHGPVWASSRPDIIGDSLTYGTLAPEPSSLLAFATFGIGVFGLRRRKA